MEAVSNLIDSEVGSVPPRRFVVAGAQLGAIHEDTPRSDVLDRMIVLMDQAHSKGAKLILFPEIALTTFFPRHMYEGEELEKWFERDEGDPTKSPGMKPIFDKAREYKIDCSVGYAECAGSGPEHGAYTDHVHYNSQAYYSAAADKVISKYRKVHLPGTFEPYERKEATNQLEKRYFLPGNLGFEAFRAPGLLPDTFTKTSSEAPNKPETLGRGDPILGTLICNDRRWPEAWRCYGLQGAELVLCGYNTTAWAPELLGTNPKLDTPEKAKAEALFHNKLSITHGSYTNSCWSINVAKAGVEDGKYPLIGGSCIVNPDGDVVAEAKTEDDELLVHEIDLSLCRRGKGKVFAFEKHRRIEAYARLVEQTGVVEPEFL